MDRSPWTDEDLERVRRSTVMLTPGSAQGLDRAAALILLEELQHLRRTIRRLEVIALEISQLVSPND